MEEIVTETFTYCGIVCAGNEVCTGVNYFPSNKTRVLLHVEDVLDDWTNNDDEDVEYSCVNCKPDPKSERYAVVETENVVMVAAHNINTVILMRLINIFSLALYWCRLTASNT